VNKGNREVMQVELVKGTTPQNGFMAWLLQPAKPINDQAGSTVTRCFRRPWHGN
jgi:hypothetical protein